MRMIKPEQLAAQLLRALLGQTLVRRAHQKTPPRAFLGRVRQRDGRRRMTGNTDECATTFVRIRFLAVAADLTIDRAVYAKRLQFQLRHRRSRTSPSNIFPRRPETP